MFRVHSEIKGHSKYVFGRLITQWVSCLFQSCSLLEHNRDSCVQIRTVCSQPSRRKGILCYCIFCAAYQRFIMHHASIISSYLLLLSFFPIAPSITSNFYLLSPVCWDKIGQPNKMVADSLVVILKYTLLEAGSLFRYVCGSPCELRQSGNNNEDNYSVRASGVRRTKGVGCLKNMQVRSSNAVRPTPPEIVPRGLEHGGVGGGLIGFRSTCQHTLGVENNNECFSISRK